MKGQLFTLFLLLSGTLLDAQNIDTVFYERFQEDIFATMNKNAPSGSDADWVDYDEDGKPTNTGTQSSKQWEYKVFYTNPTDPNTGEVNYVASSLSFLQGGLPGNRNWLILPPMDILDGNYTLHWKSAPYQLPRYLDGYVLLAAENSNTLTQLLSGDTLFQAASMIAITGNGQSLDLSNFQFTSGYIHADDLTLTQYFKPSGTSIAYGLLEPHSVSLAAYAGKKIYLAFLHNSDDDTELAIDDIMLLRTGSSGVQTLADALRFVTYPNPASNALNVMFRLEKAAPVRISILDQSGSMVWQSAGQQVLNPGEYQQNIPLQGLPSGQYLLQLNIDNQLVARPFFKQ